MSDGYYVIESTCKFGCPDHLPGQWYRSKVIPAEVAVTDAQAETYMEKYMEEYWKSKPFRLVRVVPERVVPAVETVVKEIPR